MNVKYHVGSKGAVLGEKSAEEIILSLSAGELSPADKVWLPGWTDWKTIGETPELNPAVKIYGNCPAWFEQPSLATFWQTFKTILVKPGDFASLPEAPKLSQSFNYLLFAALVNAFFMAGLLIVSGLQIASFTATTLGFAVFGLTLLGSILLSTLFATLTHWGIRLAGGNQPLRTTFATLLPCQGAGILLSMIPAAGIFLSVWPFVSGIIALAASQRVSLLKSALTQITVVLLSIIVLMVLVLLPVIVLVMVSK